MDYSYSYLRRGIACYESVLYDEKLARQKMEEQSQDDEDKTKISKDPSECKAQWEKEFREAEEKELKEKERVQLLTNAVANFKTMLTFDPSDIEAYQHRFKVPSVVRPFYEFVACNVLIVCA